MLFEEALTHVRNGKKIRSPFFKEDEYLMAVYFNFGSTDKDLENENYRVMRLIRVIGDVPQMVDPVLKKFPKDCESELHIYPQLNLLLIMRDDWEIYE